MKRIAVICTALAAAAGCHSNDPSTPDTASETQKSPQQTLIDNSAEAFRRMDRNPEFDSMDAYKSKARAVAIFPRIRRGGLIVGGSGGRGVISAKSGAGEWSAPAFYTFGGGSVGLQLGYDEATVVMFIMTDKALRSAIDGTFKVGGNVSGTAGKKSGTDQASTASDVVFFADASGLFAGVALDGAVLSDRGDDNREFYGPNATPTAILIENRFDRPGTQVLKQALMGDARVSALPQ